MADRLTASHDRAVSPPVRPYRVALIASSYDPYVGGVEAHVRSVARELRERGHDVVVWTVDRGEHLGMRLVDGVEVHYLPTPLPAREVSALVRFLVRFPGAFLLWWRAWRQFRPDVLHVQCFGPNGLYALGISRLTSTPLVVSSHGETFTNDHRAFERSALLRSSLRRALRSAVVVTGCSQVVLEDLDHRFGARGGWVVPNGIDLDADVPALETLPPGSVFAVGRLEWMKGFDLLLEAFAVADLPQGTRLVIGGEGDLSRHLRDRVAELGLQDRVHLPGRLSPDQVASFMRSAGAVVVPSRREAFGLVVLEAWRGGAPLIVTARDGPASLVTDHVTGLVVNPEETEQLARAIELLLDDRALATRLGRAGEAAVREFSWERVAELYESCYEKGAQA
jgi:glycogen synthase